MTARSGTNTYQRGMELAETGKYDAALSCMQEHLRSAPEDVQALNDAGAILHCLGRSEEAIEHLVRAYNLQSDSGEIVWNLVEAYLGAGMASEAAALFGPMERMSLLNVEVLNRVATMLLDQGRKAEAIEVLLRSRSLWPEQQVLDPILEVIRGKRSKVALVRLGEDADGALSEAWRFVQDRFQTGFYTGRTPEELSQLMQWCDIAWFDGGGPIVAEASGLPGPRRTIVSLRCSDVRDDWVRQVRWESVDILVQIGSSAVEEALLKWVPDLRNRTRLVVVPNGIDAERCLFRARPRGKNLACLGRLSLESNPAFLLQCMQKLHYLDPGYRLCFGGDFEHPMLEQYTRHMVEMLGLGEVVSFEGYPGNLNAWLEDKHFVVSSGLGGGPIASVLTGMAFGLKPVVHNFAGAERLFPRGCLYNIAEEFCERVQGQDYDPVSYRRFVEQRYPIGEHLRQVGSILNQLEAEIDVRMPEVGPNRPGIGITGVSSPYDSQFGARSDVSTPRL